MGQVRVIFSLPENQSKNIFPSGQLPLAILHTSSGFHDFIYIPTLT